MNFFCGKQSKLSVSGYLLTDQVARAFCWFSSAYQHQDIWSLNRETDLWSCNNKICPSISKSNSRFCFSLQWRVQRPEQKTHEEAAGMRCENNYVPV